MSKMMKVILPFLLCTANPGGSSGASFVAFPSVIFGLSSSSAASVNHRHGSNSSRRPAAAAADDDDDDDDDDDNSSGSSSSSPPFVSSDLKTLLPTPKKRTLRLDKFGRRVHDLTDDGTTKYNMKGEGGGEEEDATRPKSAKEMAAEASSAEFHMPASAVTTGADLKALLPKGGTRKGPSRKGLSSPPSSSSPPGPSLSQILDILNDGVTTTASDAAVAVRAKSGKERAADASRAQFRLPPISSSSRSGGSDLKALLPRQNTRFMKLDKFGRRVQRMEDDGTVNMMKEPSPSPRPPPPSPVVSSLSPHDVGETLAAVLRDGWGGGKNNYGSLRDLAPTRRETWTRLDFKGASIVDDRRTKKGGVGAGEAVDDVGFGGGGGGNLRGLLPKRATWTRLDFKGASVEDERRTRGKVPGGGGGGLVNDGRYSNLRMLLPERTITWKKNQVLSSGSATVVSSYVRGLREENQSDMKYEITGSASSSGDEIDVEEIDEEEEEEEEEIKAYATLKDLLPEGRNPFRTIR